MVFEYCTLAQVAAELNGSSTEASDATITEWIQQESESINDKTKKTWASDTFDIYLDYDGKNDIRIPLFPVLTITSFTYNDASLWQTPDWKSLTEGYDEDFLLYSKEGILSLNGYQIIPTGNKRLHITGTYGYSETPLNIVKLCAKKVALRAIGGVLNGQGTSQGGSISIGSISISDPTTFSTQNISRLDNEINSMYPEIGTFKSYRLSRRQQ